MSDTRHDGYRARSEDLIPVVMLRLLVALILSVLALVTVARLSGWPMQAERPQAELVAERLVHLDATTDGAVRVTDPDGAMVADLPAMEAGFISSIERVLYRERRKYGADQSAPILIQLREGGAVTLHDPETDWTVNLTSFGTDNVESFARLLTQP